VRKIRNLTRKYTLKSHWAFRLFAFRWGSFSNIHSKTDWSLQHN